MSLEERIEKLNEMTKIACADGTWNYDPYFHGMANGMIFAQWIMSGKHEDLCEYLDAPAQWLKDKTRTYEAMPEERK